MHIGDMTIDKLLRLYRKERGLTQAMVAAELGISRSNYAHLEQPGANPRWSRIGLIVSRMATIETKAGCESRPDHYHLIPRPGRPADD